MNKSRSGFTIVELLIVIVVIAILAAISIVAYNGIQNRANDTAVKNDLANFAKQIRLKEADTGVLPPGGAVRAGGTDTGNNSTFPNVNLIPSRSSYSTAVNNFYYCTGLLPSTSQSSFRFYARSKSGITYRYSSEAGIEDLGSAGFSSTTCLADYNNAGSWTHGYSNTSGNWHGWTL